MNFLEESIGDSGGILRGDEFVEGLIKISEHKTEQLRKGNRRWIPSQTDTNPTVAELGNWLNDRIEWIKTHKKNGTQIEVANERENDFLDLGIYVEGGITKSYFEQDAKEYLDFKKKYPTDRPKGDKRVPYKFIIEWEDQNKFRFKQYPERRQKRLIELKIVKA